MLREQVFVEERVELRRVERMQSAACLRCVLKRHPLKRRSNAYAGSSMTAVRIAGFTHPEDV